MKKNYLLLAVMALCYVMVNAEPVDLETATELAKEYMVPGVKPELVENGSRLNARRRAPGKVVSAPPYYIFSRGKGKGFVVIGGDDILPSVIGYTDEGDYDAVNAPASFRDYMYGYELAVEKYNAYIEEHGQAGIEAVKSRKSKSIRKNKATSDLGPLMTSSWEQGWPYYDYCPWDTDNNARSLTGCVATSTSSVIHYWRNDNPRYTLSSTPSYTTWTHKLAVNPGYKTGHPMKWELMKDSYGNTNYGTNSNYYTCVSELLAIVGAAVYMDYGSDGSGAQSSAQPDALGFFNLAGTNLWYSGVNNMDNWENMIIDDFEKGRPILYSGYSVDSNNNWAGHAFVVDGYRLSDGLYHFDFGWGSSWKGYWALSDANGFNTDQSMTYMIYPKHLNLSAEFTATSLTAGTSSSVSVKVTNNGTLAYSDNIYFYCSTSSNKPSLDACQSQSATIAKGGSTTLSFTVTPASGSSWYLMALDKNGHVINRIKVPTTMDDVTSTYIKNPSFESYDSSSQPSNWTRGGSGIYSRDAENDTWRAVGHAGSKVLDSWVAGDTGYGISQTLSSLPTGYYRLTAKVATDPGNTVTVFAGDQSVTSGSHECGKYYLQDVMIDGIYVSNGTLEIGVNPGSWYKVDDFHLYKYKSGVEPENVNTVKNAAAGNTYFDITDAMAPWLSTLSLGEYSNSGFAKATWGDYTGDDGASLSAPFIEKWTGSDNYLEDASISQTIQELTNGTYYIGGSFIATSQSILGKDVEGVKFWAGSESNYVPVGTSNGVPEIYALEVEVTNGTLTFGFKTECTTANWVAFDNLFLYWKGSEKSYYDQASSSNPIRIPITNPRMDNDLTGWTLNGDLWKKSDSYTNFDPDFMESWVSGGSNLSNMSATQAIYVNPGTYQLGAAVNACQQNNSSLSVSGVTLKLGTSSVSCHTGNGSPEIFKTPKATYSEGNVTAGLYISSTNANWVAWDNVVLYCYGVTSVNDDYHKALKACKQAAESNESSTSGAARAALAQYEWDDATYAGKSDSEIATAITILKNGTTISNNGQNATSFVVNANLSNTTLNGNAPYGWTNGINNTSGGGDIWVSDNVFNIWYPTINDLEITQNVSDLPNGTYRLSIDLGTIFSGKAADMVSFIIGERVGASEQVSTYNSADSRAFGTYTCAATTTSNSVFFGVRAVGHYIQMKNVKLEFISGTTAESETDASYLRQDYFWVNRSSSEVDYTTSGAISTYGNATGVKLYPKNANQIIYANSSNQFVSSQNNVVVGTTCSNLVLTDGTPLSITKQGFTATKASYTRPMSNNWGTLILPYAVQSDSQVKYYTLFNIDTSVTSKMLFEEMDEVPANTPVVFKVTTPSAGMTASANNVSVGTTTSEQGSYGNTVYGWTLTGVYSSTETTVPNVYYIASNKFYKTSGSVTINPFRAYFTVDDSDVKEFNIDMCDDCSTGIESIEIAGERVGDIYSLSGQLVRKGNLSTDGLTPGVYILNGKKVVVK